MDSDYCDSMNHKTNTNSPCAEESKFGQLLKELYFVHEEHVERLTLKAEKFESKFTKLQQQNQELEDKVAELQDEVNELKTKHIEYQGDRQRLEARLDLPCENCCGLEARLSEQDKMLDMFMSMLVTRHDDVFGKIVKQYQEMKSKKKRLKQQDMEVLIESCSMNTQASYETCSSSLNQPITSTKTSNKNSAKSIGPEICTSSTAQYGHFDGDDKDMCLTEAVGADTLGAPLQTSTQNFSASKQKKTEFPLKDSETNASQGKSKSRVNFEPVVEDIEEMSGEDSQKADIILIESSQGSVDSDTHKKESSESGTLVSSAVEGYCRLEATTNVASGLTPCPPHASTGASSTRCQEGYKLTSSIPENGEGDISPESRWVNKLTTAGKRTRSRYSEEPLPVSKKTKHSFSSKKSPDASQGAVKKNEGSSFVPQTLIGDLVNTVTSPTIQPKRAKQVKPDIVIPETMPTDCCESDDSETSVDESLGKSLQDSPSPSKPSSQDTVVMRKAQKAEPAVVLSNAVNKSHHFLFSPPSQASTPHNANSYQPEYDNMAMTALSQEDHDDIEEEPEELQNNDQSRAQRISSTQSEPLSPVFGGAPKLRSRLKGGCKTNLPVTRSPSLFEESKEDFPGNSSANMHDAMSPSVIERLRSTPLQSTSNKDRSKILSDHGIYAADQAADLDTSNRSCSSPSVLSGQPLTASAEESAPSKNLNQNSLLINKKSTLASQENYFKKCNSTSKDVPSSPELIEVASNKRKGSKRMMQTKLSAHAFNTRRSVELLKHFDKVVDKTLTAAEEELLILEQVKEASIKTFCEEAKAQSENAVFKHPSNKTPVSKYPVKPAQSLRTEKEAKQTLSLSVHVKEISAVNKAESSQDFYPPDLNGSLDPNICLSEYMSQKTDLTPSLNKPCLIPSQNALEAVSIWDVGNSSENSITQNSMQKSSQENSHGTGNINIRKRQTRSSQKLQAVSSQGSTSGSLIHSGLPDIESNDSPAVSVLPKRNADQKETGKEIKISHPLNGDPLLDDSFDRPPKKGKSPEYAHAVVVRKHAERKKLKTYTCSECYNYFKGQDLTDEEIDKRMEACRHRAKYVPPSTPEHYWSVGFPDTQECNERGYIKEEETKPSKYRRRRGYKQLFSKKEDTSPD